MSSRIRQLFESRKSPVLSVFYTAGFPRLNDTGLIAKYLADAGADMIDIGIPFSDPVADGPVIQSSNKVALDGGMNVKLLLQQVSEIRKQVSVPIVLMGYLNPVLQYGMEQFCRDAAAAGVDGLILPDMPMSEFVGGYDEVFRKYHLANTFLIAPTTSEERIREIDAATDGFIYAVSASSTTGAKSGFSQEQEAYFSRLKSMNLRNPWLIGFGISDRQAFLTAVTYAQGAIIGSAFIQAIASHTHLEQDIRRFVAGIKD